MYDPQLMFAKGTEGLYEIEPSMRWNPAVVAGVGMIADPAPLYRDMHSYLASAGAHMPCAPFLALPRHTAIAIKVPWAAPGSTRRRGPRRGVQAFAIHEALHALSRPLQASRA